MNLEQTLVLQHLRAAAAGTQATTADSRAADEWIKNWLDKKQERLNNLRVQMNTLLGPEKGEVHGAYNVYKPVISEQEPEKYANGGKWAVTDMEGLIISTWPTEAEAEEAAYPIYRGILPSATGPTGGARVRRLDAADVFTDPDLSNKTRARFLKHPKPDIVKLADWLRMGDHRPSSAGGAAGSGGTGGGGGTS
jgi:hypothetical protein